jgi:hypothetical protein
MQPNNTTYLYRPVNQAELEEFNNNIVGQIEVTKEFRK